jgi:hypothetical protein
MSKKLSAERTDGIMTRLVYVRNLIKLGRTGLAIGQIERALFQMSGAPKDPARRRCLECGAQIDATRYARGLSPKYCSQKCVNRVSHRRRYARMKEHNPAEYLAHRQLKNRLKKLIRARWLRTGKCGTCGQINDNTTRVTCERCLIKARRMCG